MIRSASGLTGDGAACGRRGRARCGHVKNPIPAPMAVKATDSPTVEAAADTAVHHGFETLDDVGAVGQAATEEMRQIGRGRTVWNLDRRGRDATSITPRQTAAADAHPQKSGLCVATARTILLAAPL